MRDRNGEERATDQEAYKSYRSFKSKDKCEYVSLLGYQHTELPRQLGL